MNNENNVNDIQPVIVPNTEPVITTEPVVVPVTTLAADKFMTVSDINQINQPVATPQPVINEPTVVPVTEPVVSAIPTVEPTLAPTPMTEAPVVSTQPVSEPVITPQQPVDNNAMINENLKKVEIKDYTPPSKLKIAILLIFFVLLVLFIIFLPNISSMIRNYKNGVSYQKEETITTGKLVCSLETNTTNLDKEYEFVFTFTDSKLKKTKYTANTRGDSTTEAAMDELNEKCTTLKEETTEIEGYSMRCDYTENKLMEMQVFNLETLDTEKLDAAFTEAGGMLPSYKYDQDIDSIEKNMKASGYTCVREK